MLHEQQVFPADHWFQFHIATLALISLGMMTKGALRKNKQKIFLNSVERKNIFTETRIIFNKKEKAFDCFSSNNILIYKLHNRKRKLYTVGVYWLINGFEKTRIAICNERHKKILLKANKMVP